MKQYKSQAEFVAEIKDNVFKSEESIDIPFHLDIGAKIEVNGDITAWNITAGNINAGGDINAWNITARDINAWNITARNIIAKNITAWNISYYAVAFAYGNIKCKKIEGRRENSKHFVLDGKIEIIK